MIPTSSYKQTQHLLALLLYLSISFLNGQSKSISFSYNQINDVKVLFDSFSDHENSKVDIGSYPFFRAGRLGVAIVLRSSEQSKIDKCN